MHELLIQPFVEFGFMRGALASVVMLALSAAPVGVFLVMRRMSLIGDALSHAVLPGAAAGYMLAGLSLPAMSIGGFAAGMLMALLAGLASRFTDVKEDANFAAFYLSSLAVGVTLVSLGGNSVELLHLLFGSVLAVDGASLLLMACVASVTLLALAVMFRPLLLESIDPLFLRAVGGRGGVWHVAFLVLVVMNLVAGFQALGTLMSVGLMMLPAVTARLWVRGIGAMMAAAAAIALCCGAAGLLFSYYVNIPSGPAIILFCGGFYLFSVLFGVQSGIIAKLLRRKHRTVSTVRPHESPKP
ncbi:metal ABC transporter permease [Conchiformibius kuhniae]|uniref:Metal ABC transporter permease n=1 Tax=Conchiformibius kuhniae TaxID=211502 RepID=A0ABD8B6V7_9NEIS